MKKISRSFLVALFTASVTTLFSTNVMALVAQPDVFGFDFRFNNPGARANAMGGAFIGLADDASAAYTNPAGLTILTKSEVSVEYKYGTYTTQIPDFGPATAEYDKDLGGMSFASYAYPQEKATITIFRHNMINTESDFIWSDGPGSNYHSDNHMELQGLTYGLGLGYKLTDNFSFGLTINSTQLEFLSTSTGIQEAGGSTHPSGYDNITRTSGTDTDEHFTVSVLWNIFSQLNLGLVYRQGPKYTFTSQNWSWESYSVDSGGSTIYIEEFIPQEPLNSELKVPDVYGIGLSYNFDLGLTLSADANYIKYSQIYDNMLWETQSYTLNGNRIHTYTPNDGFTVEDIWEYHVGLEYVLTAGQTPVALRAGYYYKPTAQIQVAAGDPKFIGNDWSRKDDNIYSAGIGLVLSENVQIDLAGMYGDLTKEGILSMVYRFN